MSSTSSVSERRFSDALTIDLAGEPVQALACLWTSVRALAQIPDGSTGTASARILHIRGHGLLPSALPTARAEANVDLDTLLASAGELTDDLVALETAAAPRVAVLEGEVLGAGMEVALACHYRILVAGPQARIGLTETGLGLLPAAGAIGRLLRQMEPEAVIALLAKARPLDAEAALAQGLVDEVVSSRQAAYVAANTWMTGRTAPVRQAPRRTHSAAAAAQTLVSLAMRQLPRQRRAAIALAAIATAWMTQDASAAAALELRRAVELAAHPQTRASLPVDWSRNADEHDESSGSRTSSHESSASHASDQAERGDAEKLQLAVQRIQAAMLVEALAMLGEGIAAERIERLALAAGLEPSPLRLLDEISLTPIDIAHHAGGHDHGHGHGHGHGHEHAHEHEHEHEHHHSHGASPAADDESGLLHGPQVWPALPAAAEYVLEKMAHGFGRLGKASGSGFYDYPDNESPRLWAGLAQFEREAGLDDPHCTDRLVYAQAIAGLRCLDNGLLKNIAELERCAHAAGFPPARGITGMMLTPGRGRFTARCEELARRCGQRFRPPAAALARMDEHG